MNDENDKEKIKYKMTKEMQKEWDDIARRKLNYGMMNDLVMEIADKLLDTDFKKIVGFETTLGQDYILLTLASDRLIKTFNSRIIKHYGMIGKDNKKRRKEFANFMNTLFLQYGGRLI